MCSNKEVYIYVIVYCLKIHLLSLYCLTQAMETESLFLINCDLYTSEREEMFNTVARIIPDIIILTNDDIFVMLMSNQDPVVTNSLGKYIYNCLKKRSNTVLMSSNVS